MLDTRETLALIDRALGDYVTWHGVSADAADSAAVDLDEPEGDWISRIVYQPWALSGDLPGPDEVLAKHPELASAAAWAIYEVGGEDGLLREAETGLTLAEAEGRL